MMTVGPQRFENRYSRRNRHGLAGCGKAHDERLIVFRRCGLACAEILEMHARRGPVSGHVTYRFHQAARAAAVDVRPLGCSSTGHKS